MEEKNDIFYAQVLKPQGVLCPNWIIVVTVCEKEKYNFVCLKEPTEKVFRKCINKALNTYIHRGD